MKKQKLKPFGEPTQLLAGPMELILFNDDVNSFDYVIDSLIDVCGHGQEQAEQCTLIAHFKGKCGVKTGSLSELSPMSDALNERGLSMVLA